MPRKKILFSVLLLLCSVISIAQTKTITGKILSANNAPLSGATVQLKNSTTSTKSGSDGTYSIMVPANSTGPLVFTFVNFETKEVEIGTASSINVSLTELIKGLDEVVVIGYGTLKKSDVISSVASIKPEKATRNITLDVGEMLRGKAAGVLVTTSDAGPNGSSDILIRGRSSLLGGNSPMVIADGVRIGSINDLNPGDIESIDILKDASAQAIYGARASNGVILITTKRGKAGKVTVNYNGYYGKQTAHRNFDVYTGPEFAQLKREADRAVNQNIMRTDAVIFSSDELAAIAENRTIDWSAEVMKPAAIQNHDLSFSGGTEKTKIYVGTNYQNMTGIVPTTYSKKGTLRLNLDQILTNWLKIGINTSFQYSTASDPGVAGIVRQVVTASPLGNIFNPDGSYNVRPGGNQESFNPLLNLQETDNYVTNRNDIQNLFIDISPVKNLNYRINLSRRSWNFKELNYNTKLSEAGVANGAASGSIYFQENVEWKVENVLSYKTHIKEHNLNFTAVATAEEQNYYNFRNSASKIPNDILGIYGLGAALINTPTVDGNQRRLLSAVGRVQYDYLAKYYVTVTGTANGSSVFGANTKWGGFYSVATGWNIHKEKFLANFKNLSNLKLRAGYGSVGNEKIDPYGSLSLANQYDYLLGVDRISGYAPGSRLANPDLKWENATTLNVGLDFGFFKNRLSGTVEYYDRRTTDLLVLRKVPATSGYTDRFDNVGEVENKGIEIQLNGTPVQTKDLQIDLGLLFSKNKNRINKLYGDLDGDGIEDNDVGNNWFIGQPIDIFRRAKYIGVWQAQEVYPGSTFNPATGKWLINGVQAPVAIDPKTNLPLVDPFTLKAPVPGTCKIEDKNGDGKINDLDNYITSKDYKWMGSFNLSAKYKGFDLSMDIYTIQGIIRDNQFLWDYTAGGDLRGNRNGIKVDYWTPENPASLYPQPNAGTSPPGMALIGLQDASYWRLQNLTVGYTLPEKISSRLKLNNVRFYATGQNIFTKTDYKAYSPEQDLYAYPMTRNFIFGLRFGL